MPTVVPVAAHRAARPGRVVAAAAGGHLEAIRVLAGLGAALFSPTASGVGTMLVAAAWMRLFPELRRMDRFPRAEATTTG